MARRFTAKPIPSALLPETVHTSRVVYFYPDKSPFSEGDAVLIGDARPAPSGISAKVLRGTVFTGGDFKVLTATKHFGGEWYGWLMPSDMQEGEAIRAGLAETRKRRKNPRKFDRCVMEVKRRGGARNPYAVCTSAGLRRRSRNPRYKRSSASVLARRGEMFTLIAKGPSGKKLVYTGAKFAAGGRPQYFRSMDSLRTAAKFLRLKYPILKKYNLYAAREP